MYTFVFHIMEMLLQKSIIHDPTGTPGDVIQAINLLIFSHRFWTGERFFEWGCYAIPMSLENSSLLCSSEITVPLAGTELILKTKKKLSGSSLINYSARQS